MWGRASLLENTMLAGISYSGGLVGGQGVEILHNLCQPIDFLAALTNLGIQ
jgi:hypothetical protein